MKASNASSASLLVSAIQISCSARFAFDCWLFGSLLSTLAVLCTLGREVALAPARVLFRPSLLETPYGRGRKPAGVLAKQRNERLLEVAGGDPLEVEDRDQHFEALRSARVGRQNRRGKANALRAFTDTVAHPRAAHADRTDAGHDLALWQMAVAHQPLAAIIGRLVGVPPPTISIWHPSIGFCA